MTGNWKSGNAIQLFLGPMLKMFEKSGNHVHKLINVQYYNTSFFRVNAKNVRFASPYNSTSCLKACMKN